MARKTPDSHDFPTRPYDLVKEFVIALVVVLMLSIGLAAIFSSPDDPPITMAAWAQNAPDDVVLPPVGELAGTSASATYGPPYNSASEGQKIGPLPLQKLGGVRLPVDSADLVLGPLGQVANDPKLAAALSNGMPRPATSGPSGLATMPMPSAPRPATRSPPPEQAVTRPRWPAGDYGPVPAMSAAFLNLARGGGLEGALTSSGNFYGGDATRSLLLLADGAYFEDQALAKTSAATSGE